MNHLSTEVLEYARTHGCDVDGDVIIYKGNRYYVDLFNDVVKKL